MAGRRAAGTWMLAALAALAAIGLIVAIARSGEPVASAAPPAPYPLTQVTDVNGQIATAMSDDGDVVMRTGTDASVLHRRTNRSIPIPSVVGGWPALSGDGTAAFRVGDDGVERLDTSTGAVSTIDVHLPAGLEAGTVATDAAGRWLAVTAESPVTLRSTVFLADTTTGALIDARAGFTDQWPQVHARPSLSADGRFLAYTHTDTESDWGLAQVFLFDRVTGTTTLMQPWQGPRTGEVVRPEVSPDGRFVTYLAHASKRPAIQGAAKPAFSFPIPNDAVALYDVAARTTQIIGATSDPAAVAFVADGGRRVVFSGATPPDVNRLRYSEVVLWEDGASVPLIRQPDGSAILETNPHGMSRDGSLVLFETNAPGLAPSAITSYLALLPALPNLPPPATQPPTNTQAPSTTQLPASTQPPVTTPGGTSASTVPDGSTPPPGTAAPSGPDTIGRSATAGLPATRIRLATTA